MRWERNVTSHKTERPRFRFNYADYVISIQRLKGMEREVSIIPQEHKAIGVLSSHVSYRRLGLGGLCLLRELRRVLTGDLSE